MSDAACGVVLLVVTAGWLAAGTAWWWRAWRRVLLSSDLFDLAFLLLITWPLYAGLGAIPWLIVRPEDYRGP